MQLNAGVEDQVSTLDLLTRHFEVSNERQRQRPIIYPVVIIMKKCHNKCTLNDAKKTIQVVLNQREKILENKETAKNTQKNSIRTSTTEMEEKEKQ